jgi:hypothetical protein
MVVTAVQGHVDGKAKRPHAAILEPKQAWTAKRRLRTSDGAERSRWAQHSSAVEAGVFAGMAPVTPEDYGGWPECKRSKLNSRCRADTAMSQLLSGGDFSHEPIVAHRSNKWGRATTLALIHLAALKGCR